MCSVDGCPKPAYCRGYCRAHYARLREGRQVDAPITFKRAPCERDAEGRKYCRYCEQWLPVANFGRKATASDGLNYRCRACLTQTHEESGRYTAWFRHGLTKYEYDVLIAGGCMACGSKENLHIDHDHACCNRRDGSCGKCVRGCLCVNCNAAFGFLGDSVLRVRQLLAYAELRGDAGEPEEKGTG